MRKIVIPLILFIILFMPVMSFALSVDDKAPGFDAPSTHGTVILSEFEGKKNVVLALYYADFTPV